MIDPNSPRVVQILLRDWAHIARCQASECLGTPEAATLLVEAKRYELAAETIKRMMK